MSKTIRILTTLMITVMLLIPVFLSAQNKSWTIPEGMELHARGTGRTTGHIGDFSIHNSTGRARDLEIPPVVIPSDGVHQGYAIPEPIQLSVPGRSTVTVPITGYCTDPNLPAPLAGTILPSVETWDTDAPLLPVLQKIVTSVIHLQDRNMIFTPLSGSPQEEKTAITQQCVWIYSMPAGTYDPCQRIYHFITNQYRDTDWYSAGRENIDQGIAQITDAIIRVGRSAGLDGFSEPVLPIQITQAAQASPSSHPDITKTAKAKGTGRTTGHIADLTISNPTNEPINVVIGSQGSSFLIPSDGHHQSYIVPSIPEIPVGPGKTVTIPIEGYCVDVRRPPVGDGSSMPAFSGWIGTVREIPPPDPMNPGGPHSTAVPVSIPVKTAPLLSIIAGVLSNTPAAPVMSKWNCPDLPVPTTPLIPGTETPIRIPINTDEATGIAAPILSLALMNIMQAYDELQPSGVLITPFSNNRDREREAVIQQTFWIYSSALQGEPYTKEDLQQNTVKQFEHNSNRKYDDLPEEQKEKIDAGVDDFWNSFSAVGLEAKILPSVPDPSIDLPVLEDVFNPENIKQYSSETPSPFSAAEDVLIRDEKKKEKPHKENRQCECGMVSVKITAWDFDETTNKSQEGTGKSDTRNAATSNVAMDNYEINLGKDKIPAGQSQIIMIYVEKIECPCVDLAAEGVINALEKLQEAGKMKVGQNSKEIDLAKLGKDLKDLKDKKRKTKSDEKKITQFEAKISAIKAAQEEISKAKAAAKASECTIFYDQSDVRKKPEERKKNPGIEVKAGTNSVSGKWDKDSGNNQGYVFKLKKEKNKPMEFHFDISFHCQGDDCKPVTCRRTFVVKVEK